MARLVSVECREARAARAAEKRYAEACAVICIDPGKRTGYACINEGRITAHGTVGSGHLELLPAASIALIEEPVIYPNPAKQKGDPNIIRRLAMLAERIRAIYALEGEAHYVQPRDWRGMTPEHVLLHRVRSSLLPGETLGRSVHARDAQGMAFWLLKRPLWCK